MNRSSFRRLVEGTKSRIKAANTPRDDILSEIEYRKLLRLVDELDRLVARASSSSASRYTYSDMELVAIINARRESLASVLHRLISDSAHANREGRAINRWSYKKKLHAVSKELVKSVQADVVKLRCIVEREFAQDAPTLSTSVDIGFDTKSAICHRTVAAPPPDYLESLDSFVPEPPSPIEPNTPHRPESIPTLTPNPINTPTAAVHSTSPRGCLLILSMVASFILFSCIAGLYFTLEKSHGYSMGDAFTLAGYIVAVGALVSTAAMAKHWPSCRCWKGSPNFSVAQYDIFFTSGISEHRMSSKRNFRLPDPNSMSSLVYQIAELLPGISTLYSTDNYIYQSFKDDISLFEQAHKTIALVGLETLESDDIAILKRVYGEARIYYYTSGMLPPPNLISHVSSAAFAQARLRAAQVLIRPLTLFTRFLETINF
ncbi:hypothetical protein BDZ45DRAFT_726730 [Acephala macrosclerotiorum]|nr:hypothetical protein BDZ45DRAFT_726730 [Acephala macrosclerotiorum]